MKNIKIGIIGGGNMGGAIATGLVKSGQFTPQSIMLSTRTESHLKKIKSAGFSTTQDNEKIVDYADIIIFAVKPYQIIPLMMEVQHLFRSEQDIISVAAKVTLETLHNNIKHKYMYRVMPNIAAASGCSFTGLSTFVTDKERIKSVNSILNLFGESILVDESQLEAVTILSGSGIAYALRFLRASMQGGTAIGVSPALTARIVAQAMKGASTLVLENNSHPEGEIDKITTPKGTTITGLNAMEKEGFSHAVIEGILKSYATLNG